MDNQILANLKKNEYLIENNISVDSIRKISSINYIIETSDGNYNLVLVEQNKDDFDNDDILNKLDEIGAKTPTILTSGYLDDLAYGYYLANIDGISLEEYIKSHDKNDIYCAGYKFGCILQKLHKIPSHDKLNWYELFNTRSNYLFYMHGVGEVGDDDYILIDYIRDNKHLSKNIETSYLYKNMDLDNIYIDDDLNLTLLGLDFRTTGDGVYDFTRINRIAIDNREFAKGTIDGYFNKEKAPIKFHRLLSLYEAYQILDSMVKIRQDKDHDLSQRQIDELNAMYDNFNQEVPNWT